MKTNKLQAKQHIDVYGSLLSERAVISEITSEDVRGQTRYSFTVFDRKAPLEIQCEGVQHLATVLCSMWFAYEKAWYDSGVRFDDSI